MIFIGHFLPECILLRLVVNLQPLVRQRVKNEHLIVRELKVNNVSFQSYT